MIQRSLIAKCHIAKCHCRTLGLTAALLLSTFSVHAAPTVTPIDTTTAATASTTDTSLSATGVNNASSVPNTAVTKPTSSAIPSINNTLAAQLKPTDSALSEANQTLLSRNAQLQRQVNDLQTQANVLVYESKGQLFMYGAFTVLISLLVGIFISWLVFVRRERW